ncbi:MAG TPA: hypothetical protein EYP59_13430 [Thiotrichaceae bacterium]|nr:hypothetical protein [Thiotrichaceae bacterium]
MKLKTLSLMAGMALAANMGLITQAAAELDNVATEVPAVSSQEILYPVTIEYDVEDNIISVYVNGVRLEQVEHFIFNNQVIDDFVHDGREDGSITVGEEENAFMMLMSSSSIQNADRGVFGITISNGTTVSSEIPSELLNGASQESSRGTRKRRKCKAKFEIDNETTGWIYLGTVGGFLVSKKKKCKAKAYSYARYNLHYSSIGFTGQEFCEEYGKNGVRVEVNTEIEGKSNSKDGEVSSMLQAKCQCSGYTFVN